jgi:hypothetical protein
MRFKKCFLAILFLLFLNIKPFPDVGLYRFYFTDIEQVRKVDIGFYDIASFNLKEKYIDLVLTEKEFKYLKVYFKNYQKIEVKVGKLDSEYTTYNELVVLLTNYENTYPDICRVYDIGDAWEKTVGGADYNLNYKDREIYALKISSNVVVDEDEPAFLFIGCHHARETISVEVPLKIADYLLTNYSTVDTITKIVDNYQVWVVPMLNPDGHSIVADGDDVWWRKNARDNNGDHSYAKAGDGVDPNRNYAHHWGTTGTSHNPDSIVYCGTAPFSEPEVQALVNLAKEIRPVFSISYHSYGEQVLYPFGYSERDAPDDYTLYTIAKEVAGRIENDAGSGYYEPIKSSSLYCASGDSDDWLYAYIGTFPLTVELSKTFSPAGSMVDDICNRNLKGAMYLFERINGPSVFGKVRDKYTNETLECEILVDEIGYDDIQIRNSHPDYGSYRWILSSGNYNIHFYKDSYKPVSYNFYVSTTPVCIDVFLEKLSAEQEAQLIYIYPNPIYLNHIENINIIYNLNKGTKVTSKIYNISGELIYKIDAKTIHCNPFIDNEIICLKKEIASGVYILLSEIKNENFSKYEIFKFAILK